MSSPLSPQFRAGTDGVLMYFASSAMSSLISLVLVFIHGIYAIRRSQNNKVRFIIVWSWIGGMINCISFFSVEAKTDPNLPIPLEFTRAVFASGLLTTILPNILLLNIISAAFAGIGDVFGRRLLIAGYVLAFFLFIGQIIVAFYPFNLGAKGLMPGYVMTAVNNISMIILYSFGLKMLYSQRRLPTVRKLLNRFVIFYMWVVHNMLISTALGISYVYMYAIIPEYSTALLYRMPMTLLPYLSASYGPEMILRNNMFVAGNILMADPKQIDSKIEIQEA